MELRHLRYFLAVAQELHFSRAAEQLHISQPPLSRQIQDLERELGVALFRRNRRVELTDAGERLLARAQRVVDALDDFTHAAELVATGVVRTLRLGYPATVVDPVVAAAVRRFEQRCPDVDLSLHVDGSGPHLRAVRADLLDAAFVRSTADRCGELAHRSLLREPFVVALHPDHRLVDHAEVSCHQLRGMPLVLPDPASEPHLHDHLVDAVLGDLEPEPCVVLETSSIESVYSAVVAQLGVAVIPRSSAALLRGGDVVCRPFAPPAPATDLLLVWDADRVEQPLAAFLDGLHDATDARPPAPAVPHPQLRPDEVERPAVRQPDLVASGGQRPGANANGRRRGPLKLRRKSDPAS